MARASMRWILDCPEVSAVIPGFRSVRQIEDNLGTLEVPSFTMEEKVRLARFYQERVAEHIRGAY